MVTVFPFPTFLFANVAALSDTVTVSPLIVPLNTPSTVALVEAS